MEKLERLLVKPDEGARLLGIGRSKMYALLATGVIPSIKVGGSTRIPADALRRWVERQLAEQDRAQTATG